jgi:hypothetical protein
VSLKSLIKGWPKATTETPDAYKGSQAMNTLGKFIVLTVIGMGTGLLGAAGVIFGGIAYLCGAGGALMTGGAYLACGGAAAFTAAMGGIKYTALRNAPHIDAYAQEEKKRKNEQELRAAAELEAAHERKKPKKAAKEFNPEAAVRLGNDIKTMRPLKLNVKAPQQPQVNA